MQLLDGRTYAFQWDSNISVILTDAKVGDEIHFAHRKDKKSLVAVAEEIDSIVVAKVPNLLLQRPGFIQIYHFITDDNGNRTISREELKVLEKEKPDDYLYEESQVLSWEYLDKRITELEKTISEEAVNTKAFNLLIEEDMLPAVRNADGAILTDQNGNIVLRY